MTYFLCSFARFRNAVVVIATALTGIAATLLPGGTTAHSRFGVPVPMSDDVPTSNIPLHSERAAVLRDAQLIVIDEATMGLREMYELIDRLLKDIMRGVDAALEEVPFGGKTVVLAGDFRQLAPVVRHAGRPAVRSKTLRQSTLWEHFRVLKMVQNMRVARLMLHNRTAARLLEQFAKFLLDIGDGILDPVEFPEDVRVEFEDDMKLIDNVFPNLLHDAKVVSNACILTTLNKYVDTLNEKVLDMLPQESTVYTSADSFGPEAAELEQQYPVEILNTLTPAGLPPHKLVLKEGVPVVFMRNITRQHGVMNGTRAMVAK